MRTPTIEPFWRWQRFLKEKQLTCGLSFYITPFISAGNAVAFHQAHGDEQGVDTLQVLDGCYLNDCHRQQVSQISWECSRKVQFLLYADASWIGECCPGRLHLPCPSHQKRGVRRKQCFVWQLSLPLLNCAYAGQKFQCFRTCAFF